MSDSSQYLQIENNTANNNNRKMNDLLQRIGTNSKPLFNKLTFKPSKKTEFLEIVERKLGNILTGINLDNIEKKLNELDKIFDKLQQFSGKITNITNENIKSRLRNIYLNNRLKFPAFSAQILRITNSSQISLEDLIKLLQLQNKLIEIYKKYFTTPNNKNSRLDDMLKVKQILDERIKELSPNKNLQSSNRARELLFKVKILDRQLIPNEKKGIVIPSSNEEKEKLSAYLVDLGGRIFNELINPQTGRYYKKLRYALMSIVASYKAIFINPFRKPGQNIKNVKEIANNKKIIVRKLDSYEQHIANIVKKSELSREPATYSEPKFLRDFRELKGLSSTNKNASDF